MNGQNGQNRTCTCIAPRGVGILVHHADCSAPHRPWQARTTYLNGIWWHVSNHMDARTVEVTAAQYATGGVRADSYQAR